MDPLDYTVIVLYFVVVIGVGCWYRRRAAKDLDSYFLGGKRLHWLALAMSGSVSNFDITGTMWMVTLMTLFGMKSTWNHWMWGFLMGAFFLAFMGKWIRRSRVMTGAEWMVTRFGDRRDGRIARIAYTLMAVVTVTAFVGYAFQGIGKFTSVYVSLKPAARVLSDLLPGYSDSIWFLAEHEAETCAVAIFALTTLYVLLGGLYSVVITDVIQTVMLTLAAILIAAIAYARISPEMLAEKLPADFTSLIPSWRLAETQVEQLAGGKYAFYEFFGALVIVWVLKGLLLNLGGPAQMYDFQRFLCARHPRDAAKVGAAWSGFLVVRWAMVMAIALLFLTGLARADDPEKVMPVVLQEFLPVGIRGLVIAGLLAAFMSTFSSTVNSGASYLVRDLWQPLVRPHAGQRHLIWASYVSTIVLVLAGLTIGFHADSIRGVFDWIMGALGAAFVVPNVLRWYWWRLNGWGYAIGTLVGLVAALIIPFVPSWNYFYYSFPLIATLSLAATLAITMCTRPTDEAILLKFFERVRPFGFWGPIRRHSRLSARQLDDPAERLPLAALNVLLGGVAILGIYLGPMYLVGHWHLPAAGCLGVAVAAMVVLYFTWYRNLPPPEASRKGIADYDTPPTVGGSMTDSYPRRPPRPGSPPTPRRWKHD